MKKKIIITVCSMEIGGIERSAAGLIDSIDSGKYDVDLLLFSRRGEFLPLVSEKCNVLPEIPQCATLLKPVKEVALSGHPLMVASRIVSKIETDRKFKNSGYNSDALVFAYLQSVWDKSIRFMPPIKEEYDAVLSFMWPHHYAAQKIRAKKKIAWVHTDYTKAALDFEADRSIWECFDKIAAVSDECGEAFKSVYPSLYEKVVTIENVLSADFVRAQAREFVPDEMQTPSIKLLTAGRFCYQKAFDNAVRLCKILLERGMNIKWYALGYGTEEEKIKSMVRELGIEESFIFLGKKINPYPYMKACDIYVQPSRYEGKAVTVREAQMLGRPVMITDFNTARSQVRDGFDAIISPMEINAAADTLQMLINSSELRESLSQNALSSDYSNTSYIERLFEIIEAGE
jgi:glycosyltransferase involved in cell wall biosynthesis